MSKTDVGMVTMTLSPPGSPSQKSVTRYENNQRHYSAIGNQRECL